MSVDDGRQMIVFLQQIKLLKNRENFLLKKIKKKEADGDRAGRLVVRVAAVAAVELVWWKAPSFSTPIHKSINNLAEEKNHYDYGNAEYWNARYLEEAGASFDWYQRYSALRPFLRKFVPCSSRILMVGCGNALMSEDMVNDGYVDVMNIDISSIVIGMQMKSCAHIPQLKYMQMDVRDMSFFEDETFDSVIDKGTLDSLMCGTDAPFSASQMIYEVNRLLKPGGIFMLVTYGDPSVRITHLNQSGCCWEITLYILPRPDFKIAVGSSSLRSVMEPVPLIEKSLLPPEYVLEDPESHYIYVCKKMEG